MNWCFDLVFCLPGWDWWLWVSGVGDFGNFGSDCCVWVVIRQISVKFGSFGNFLV